MPVVPWSTSGGDVDLEDSATSSSSVLFLALIATGLTAAAAVALIRRISKTSLPTQPLHNQFVPMESEKARRGNEPLSPVDHQQLYQHFPGRTMSTDDGLRQGDSDSGLWDRGSSGSGLPSGKEGSSPSRGPQVTDRPGSSESQTGKHIKITAPRFMMTRPPPPPPLTPPELSSNVFNIEKRRLSYTAASPDMGTFFDQPNPDYMSEEPRSQTTATSTTQSPSTPRRRSYTKSIPIGIPALTPSASMNSDASDLVSSSFPPTMPFLPGPPPGQDLEFAESPQEIGVQGEIISVLDDAGTGWKRHTRVYGGGVCLACAASGGEGHGGFYGHNVRPEDRF